MMSTLLKGRELKAIFIAVLAIFAAFLALPFVEIIYQAFSTGGGFGFDHFATMLSERNFATAFGNSITIASVSALISTILAFILAYTIHYTNLNGKLKKPFRFWHWRRCFCRRLHTVSPLSIRWANRAF